MSRVQIFAALPPGQSWAEIFDPRDPGLISFQSDKALTFTYAAGNFANWKITARGIDFTYVTDQNGKLVPTGGSITVITVQDATGTVVLRLDKFAVAARLDLAEYYYTIFNTGSEADARNGSNLFTQLLKLNDVIIGSSNGDDIASGFNWGNDTIRAGLGDDFVRGDAGSDRVDGGEGTDTLSFQTSFIDDSAFRGINLNAVTGLVTDCWGGQDTISRFENFRGSKFADRIIGTETDRERFGGLRGADTLDGAGGTRDEAYYDRDIRFGGSLGIVCDLEVSKVGGEIRGTIRDGFGHVDRVIDIERVRGTMKDDIFVGSSVDNMFTGIGGVDNFKGGAGKDGLSFSANTDFGATVGVDVDLSRSTGQVQNDGFGNTENASGMENLFGSKLVDILRGDSLANVIQGDAGLDTLSGGGGIDTFVYAGLPSIGDTIEDFVSGVDKLSIDDGSFAGMDNIVRFNNGDVPAGAGSWFFFKASDSTLYWDRDGDGTAFTEVAIVTLTGLAAISGTDLIL